MHGNIASQIESPRCRLLSSPRSGRQADDDTNSCNKATRNLESFPIFASCSLSHPSPFRIRTYTPPGWAVFCPLPPTPAALSKDAIPSSHWHMTGGCPANTRLGMRRTGASPQMFLCLLTAAMQNPGNGVRSPDSAAWLEEPPWLLNLPSTFLLPLTQWHPAFRRAMSPCWLVRDILPAPLIRCFYATHRGPRRGSLLHNCMSKSVSRSLASAITQYSCPRLSEFAQGCPVLCLLSRRAVSRCLAILSNATMQTMSGLPALERPR